MSYFSYFLHPVGNSFAYCLNIKINKMKIPKEHQTVMPYLIIKGADKFIAFAKKVFNAAENTDMRSMREDKSIMHSEIRIGESTIMFSDGSTLFEPRPFGFFIYVENADETYKKALDEGAEVLTELSDQHYGRSGGVTDPFGNVWWITS